ncbi:MAG TPA: Uma2 family endonuclease [Candidatus Fraserbacteria bacterium]|nr:Uma2 family endonuclease [Candidatus Fraserbacteria bacterium]
MAQTQVKLKFMLEDYRNLPESEIKRYELLGGEIVMAPVPIPYHQEISGKIYFALVRYIRDHHLGKVYDAPLDVILSPATAGRDRSFKRTLYARSRVREYWLVDPDSKSIEVLALGPQGYQPAGRYEKSQTLRSPLLTGLSVAPDEVF